MSTQPLVELVSVVKSFGSKVPVDVLKGVSLKVEPAQVVALMGPSGSGKSTLLSILGLLEKPSSGSVLIKGRQAPSGESSRAHVRRQHFGFVFQRYELIAHLSASENVSLVQRFGGQGSRVDTSEALSIVGLTNRKNHLPSQLSGGEQQRVAIARAIVTHPALIIADEPTGNLDSPRTKEMIDLFRRLAQRGVASIIATHDRLVAEGADTVLRIEDGLVASEKAPKEPIVRRDHG